MFSTLVSATLVSVFAIIRCVHAQEFTIATVTLQQCNSVQITWSGGNGPYDLAVVSSKDPCETILANLGSDLEGQSFNWSSVALPANADAMFSIIDANFDEAWSGPMIVANGSHDCLPNGPSSHIPSNSPHIAGPSNGIGSPNGQSSLFVASVTSHHSGGSTTLTSQEVGATAIGASNSGLLPDSGAISSARLPTFMTILCSFAAVLIPSFLF